MEGDKVGQSEKDGDDLDRAERGELTGNDSTITKRTAGEQKAYVSNATSQQQRIRQQGELNKVIEYRVCINIYEARKLQGTGKNPALRVACKCGQQVKKTNSRKGSLSPKFNEVKIFTFSCTHEKMLGKPLEIKVQNVKQVLRDGLVGSFKMSLGMVYAQPDHCYAYKWLLLSDPKNSACEMKGYLKVSVHVAGGNDPSMSFPLSSQKQESDEDIETNLLRHAGVSLVPGIITIRVYKGEDFPQMDPDYFKHFKSKDAKKKDLVDPYCTIRFAGHKQKTKIIENRSYPDWNTELKLNVLFPSLSEAITFQAMDYDKLSEDDYIGTVHLKISHISETGRSGFPPTFGPCFVNIYGSTREFESWEFESSSEYVNTNKGLVEGVAYRGRILVEVNSDLDHTISEPINQQMISGIKKELYVIEKISYKLMGVFFSATMVHPHTDMIEFELSIGDYGYMIDIPCDNTTLLSRTPPLRPSSLSCKQSNMYFIPWMEQKPCIEVDSLWEDCSHRIEALNILLHISEDMEYSLSKIKELLVNSCKHEEATDSLMIFLETLGESLDQRLPIPPRPKFNLLDSRMMELRLSELKSMKEGIQKMMKRIKKKHGKEKQAQILSEVMTELDDYLISIKYLCVEPQNSVPDVIIWMLHKNKRVAYKRIPSHEVMYASTAMARGKNCCKMQTISLQAPPTLSSSNSPTSKQRIGTELSVILWLGTKEDYNRMQKAEIKKYFTGGRIAIFAEKYEYQKKKSTEYKDNRGNRLHAMSPKDNPLSGWKWSGGWKQMQPFDSQKEGEKEYTERIYEYASISDPKRTEPEETFWGDEHVVKEQLSEGHKKSQYEECPLGWKWKDKDWLIDHRSSLNPEGWMYAVECDSLSWAPIQRSYHKFQRRQLVRVRERTQELVQSSEVWESTKHGRDQYKRLRLIREIVQDESTKGTHHKILTEKLASLQKYLTFSESHVFQLRAYLYQARDLYGSDRSGLSDPYAIVSFDNHSIQSIVMKETLCPVWNQTIIENEIKLYGDKNFIRQYQDINCIIIQLWDKDQYFKDEYLGMAYGKPLVRLTLDSPQPQLQWLKVMRRGENAGDILAAFELILDEDGRLPFYPLKSKNGHHVVPGEIAPRMETFIVEFRCWGIRNMKKLKGSRVSSPFAELECGGRVIRTECISNARKNDNFPGHFLTMKVTIPTDIFLPPLNIKVYDKRNFRRMPLVGNHVVKSVEPYVVKQERSGKPDPVLIQLPQSYKPLQLDKFYPYNEEDIMYDWWSKYYFSLKDKKHVQDGYERAHKDSLVVFEKELEHFFSDGFTDFLQSFPLYRGKGSHDDPEDQVGSIKAAIRLYPAPSVHEHEPGGILNIKPSNEAVDILVRVYVVEGINLTPMDIVGSSDPYLKVAIGKRKDTTKDNPIKNTLNPIFGKMFEIPATLPYDHTLSITVMDADRMSRDDLIGTTVIDVENRFYSRHRATCGLPQSVTVYGSNKWHNSADPVEILYEWVKREGMSNPEWCHNNTEVTIIENSDSFKPLTYSLEEFEPENTKNLPKEICKDHQQRLALYILRKNGVLVPEHVETRTLYHPMHPGVAQGQLRLWIDIFKRHGYIPPPVDISPRMPEEYELRVIVWNTMDVDLDEVSFMTGEAMSDIYVRGWLQDSRNSQKTDVHYRSLDGTGYFNWRFKFPFHYIMAEDALVIRKKEHFYNFDKTDFHERPILTIEVWDDDAFSSDDFLGRARFNLSDMPLSLQKRQQSNQPQCNLFKAKRVKGWWPVYYCEKDGTETQSGKVELEFELLTRDEAQLKPAGKGRDEPNMNPRLLPPNRPDTSFFWLLSPLKSWRFIIWKYHKWSIFGVLAIIVFIIVIITLAFTLPREIMRATISKILP